MIESEAFPRLNSGNHRETSTETPESNCIAWSAGDTEHWWQPGLFWPIETPSDDFGIGVLERAFRTLGYEDCGMDDSFEDDFEKVALFGNSFFYTHAARQLPGGAWTSKLGRAEDIEHDNPEVVAGGVHGEVVQIMKRRKHRR